MVGLNYLNFDLSIERADAAYRSRVLTSPVGEANAPFDPPSASAAPADAGRLLFQAAFTGEVLTAYRRSLDAVERRKKGLRIRLLLADVPEVADLPWERLYDPSRDRALGLSAETPLVRYLALPEPARALEVTPPLAVLAIIASPNGYPPLNVAAEWAALQSALAELANRGRVQLMRLTRPTLNELQRELRRQPIHVLHFLGHGGFDPATGEGLLVMTDAAGGPRAARASDLVTILGDHKSLRLAVLNACQGAQTDGANPYAGTAQRLVQRGIPAVVAMRTAISDSAASAFAHEFYLALAEGYPVDAAVVEGRKALLAEGNENEWGVPALFMRAPDGRLFDIEVHAETETGSFSASAEDEPPSSQGQPAAAFTHRARPALGGDSISHFGVRSAATLGCLVRDRADRRTVYLLSDYSGLTGPGNIMQAGDPVVQPGVYDGGNPATDTIATLARWGALSSDPAAAATNLSAALATVLNLADVSPEIRGRGHLAGVRAARPGQRVYAVGRTSGEAAGTVLRVGVTLTLPGQITVPFADLIQTTALLQPGDSGAVLLDEENYVLGLGFASGSSSFFHPMQRVLDALDVNLVTEAMWRELTRPIAAAPAQPIISLPPSRGAPPPAAAQPGSTNDVAALAALREHLTRRRAVFFIGSDYPATLTGVPGRAELAVQLATKYGLASNARLATIAQQVMSHGNRFGFTSFIRDALDVSGHSPHPIHRALARLVLRWQLPSIFTLAYDNLLDLALREANIPFDIATQDSQLPLLRGDRLALYKLYGTSEQPASLIVTEQDENAFLRGKTNPDIWDELRRAFRRNCILFIGYDLTDPAVTALFDEIAGADFQIPSFALWPGMPAAAREALRSNRGLTVLEADPLGMLEALLAD